MAKNQLQIVFENDEFVAVSKPTGMLSIPDRGQTEKSLKEILIEKYGNIFTVHRLDKDTSGLILFAKTEVSHKFFSRLFEERKMPLLSFVYNILNRFKSILITAFNCKNKS